jgi:hypothetical protein
VNTFAHARLVLPLGRPLTTAGAILPDLVRYAGARGNHRPLVVQGPAAGSDLRAQLDEVAAGVRCHLEADAVFHGQRPFVDLLQGLTRFTRRDAPELANHWTRWLLPHLVAEIVLDRLLVRADPDGAESCYEAMATLRAGDVLGSVAASYEVPLAPLAWLLGEWVTRRRLHSYETLDGIAFAVERALGRFGRRVIEDSQAEAFARLVDYAEQCIGDPFAMLPAPCGRPAR